MIKRNLTNINDYTLIEQKDITTEIYFYPQYALTNQKIKSKKEQLCVLFELKKEKEKGVYQLRTYLLDKEGHKIFQSYSLYLKELAQYKYVLLKSKNDHQHADIIKKEIIDFNTLDYDSFLNIISKNSELVKMLPDLKMGLEENVESLVVEKRKAAFIDLPSPQNYYQNVTGYITDELTKQLTTEEEIEQSQEILKNIKKNFKVVLYDKHLLTLAYTAIYALILNKIKGNTVKPSNILDSKELKTDTNKTTIAFPELDYILNNFIKSIKDDTPITKDLNIIQERIEYALSTKPKQKEITDFIKVILIDDKYTDSTKRNRCIEETELKELLIKSLINYTYRPLPRNQVLLYNEENNNIDFVCIISLDKLNQLLYTYKINVKDNNEYLNILRTIDNVITKGQHKKTENTLILSIYTLLHITMYNYKNINKNALLFDKGTFIPNLEYNLGDYNITIINRLNGKTHGKLNRLTIETKELVRKSLNKNEKSFNKYLNELIYYNINESLLDLNITIKIKDLTNNDIKIKISKSTTKDCFDCSFTIGELLIILSSLKQLPPKEKNIEDNQEEQQEELIEEIESPPIEEPLISQEEYDYIMRKSNTIVNIMNTINIENETYEKVVELYNSLEKSTMIEKEKIILELKDLLK